MGKLMVAPTMLRVKEGVVSLGVNLRRPQGKANDAFREALRTKAVALARDTHFGLKEGAEVYVGDPHVADTQGPLVDTLLGIYRRRHSNSEAKAISVRGGTYARLFPGAVDFGPSSPGAPYEGHAPNESIALSTLEETARMLSEAVYSLAIGP